MSLRSATSQTSILGLVLFAAGCANAGGDADPGPDSSLGTAADASDRGSGADAGDSGTDAAPAELVELSGTAFDGEQDEPLSDAVIEVDGAEPPIETVSGQDGSFSLQVPSGTPVELRASKAGFMDSIYHRVIPEGGETGLAVTLITESITNSVASSVGLSDLPASAGMVIIDFVTPSSSGGEGADLDRSYEGVYTLDGGGAPVASDVLVGDGEPLLVFHAVTPGDAAVTVDSPVDPLTCAPSSPQIATLSVEAGSYSFLEVTCTP